jgi:hypothetical protein
MRYLPSEEIFSDCAKGIPLISKFNKDPLQEHIVSVRTPSELTEAAVKGFEDRTFGNKFLITGVEVNQDTEDLSRSCLDDFISNPHHLGFLTSVDSMVHVYNVFKDYISLKNGENSCVPLELVFSSTITKGFENLEGENPACWIHIGHGDVEQRLISPEDEYEDEYVDDIPMLSEGSDETNFIDTSIICKIIKEMEGDILFCALPLCYSKQNGDELQSVGNISLIHGVYDSKVNSMNEFSDGETEIERSKENFDSWIQWVREMRSATRRLSIELLNSDALKARIQ